MAPDLKKNKVDNSTHCLDLDLNGEKTSDVFQVLIQFQNEKCPFLTYA